MGKPRIYGLPATDPQKAGLLDRAWQRKQKRQRQRESTTPKAVAAQIRKEEGTGNG